MPYQVQPAGFPDRRNTRSTDCNRLLRADRSWTLSVLLHADVKATCGRRSHVVTYGLGRRSTWSSPKRYGVNSTGRVSTASGSVWAKRTPTLRALQHARGRISSLDETPTDTESVDSVRDERRQMTEHETNPPRRWRTWGEAAELFDRSKDPTWPADRTRIVDEVRDPWSRAAQADELRASELQH
jgi:hypothetical protein